MPFYGPDCVSFSFHFSSLRPGFRAIRLAYLNAFRAVNLEPLRLRSQSVTLFLLGQTEYEFIGKPSNVAFDCLIQRVG